MLLYSDYPFWLDDALPNQDWWDPAKIIAGNVDLSKYPRSPKAKNLLMKLLCVDPAKRISAADALNDPWFKDEEEEEEEERIEEASCRALTEIEKEIESAKKKDDDNDGKDDIIFY